MVHRVRIPESWTRCSLTRKTAAGYVATTIILSDTRSASMRLVDRARLDGSKG